MCNSFYFWLLGGPVESEESCQSKGSKPTQDPFRAQYDATLVEDWQGTLKAVNEGSSQIADARSEARFLGQVSAII